MANLIADFDDLLAGGASLEELAAETEMTLGQLNWRAGDTGGDTGGIAAYDGFANAAAQVSDRDFPTIETLEDGGIFALRLDALVDARPDSFENVIDQIATDWSAVELSNALQAEAALILASLSGGATLSSLGLPVAVETDKQRDGVFLGQPQGFLAAVFDLQDIGAAGSVEGNGNVVIMQLNRVSAADPNDPQRAALLAAIKNDAAQSLGEDALTAFTRALQTEAGINLNQSAINAVHAQFPGGGGAFTPAQN